MLLLLLLPMFPGGCEVQADAITRTCTRLSKLTNAGSDDQGSEKVPMLMRQQILWRLSASVASGVQRQAAESTIYVSTSDFFVGHEHF